MKNIIGLWVEDGNIHLTLPDNLTSPKQNSFVLRHL